MEGERRREGERRFAKVDKEGGRERVCKSR
jgi:hypothetical protein